MPIKLLIIGAGARGYIYASYAASHPDQVRVVGVADPRPAYRERLAAEHQVPAANVVADWSELAARPRFADAVIIATPDALHAAPAVAFAQRGYHILLEKPMAPTEADSRRIAEAAAASGVLLAICHVLRYTPYTRRLKGLLADGLIGDIVNIQRLEPVGYWHQAHSFVRGNWRRADESSSMLLAKCCHDLDWLSFIMGDRCVAVHSFGGLFHFRPENKPAGAAARCLDCQVEADCPYSARKIYLNRVAADELAWPVNVLTPLPDEASVMAALRDGPYGRCVYECDNDVVDHQVVNLQFASGATASLTMIAFAEAAKRQTRIFGTRGELVGDGRLIRHFDFLTDTWREIDSEPAGPSLSGHSGGDAGVMAAFLAAVAAADPDLIASGPAESLASHLMVFAAERSRLEGRVVRLDGHGEVR